MLVGYPRLEALFRRAAGLDLTKQRAKEICEFVQVKLHDLLLVAERNARYNNRQVIWEADLPITKGLAESIRQYRELEMEEGVEPEPILEHLATVPPLAYPLEVEVEQRLPEIAGGLMLCMARILKVLNGGGRAFEPDHLEAAEEILDLTL